MKHTRSLSVLAGLILFCGPLAAQIPAAPLPSGTESQIDALLTYRMKELGIPGASLTVVDADRILYSKGFGQADDTGRRVTADTPFLLGSTTKSFTAMAVRLLAHQGRVDLDAPVTVYLPEFRMAGPFDSGRITVRHLLNQSSGIPHRTARGFGQPDRTVAEVLAGLASEVPAAAPGARFEYCETNYVLLGEIVRRLSGASYPGFLEAQVLAPLGLSHTHATTEGARADGLAQGHRTLFGLPFAADLPVPERFRASAYLASSGADLGRYLQGYLGAFAGRDTGVLPAAVQRDLLAPGVAVNHPEGYSYAMGWFTNGREAFHTGEIANSYSALLLDLDGRIGVALAVNANNKLVTGEYARTIAWDVRDLVLGRQGSGGSGLGTDGAPSPTGFGTVYLVFNSLAAVLLLGSLARLALAFRFPVPLRRPGALFVRVLPDLAAGLILAGALQSLLGAYDTDLGDAWIGQPDLVLVLAGASGIFFFSHLVRLVRWFRAGR